MLWVQNDGKAKGRFLHGLLTPGALGQPGPTAQFFTDMRPHQDRLWLPSASADQSRRNTDTSDEQDRLMPMARQKKQSQEKEPLESATCLNFGVFSLFTSNISLVENSWINQVGSGDAKKQKVEEKASY